MERDLSNNKIWSKNRTKRNINVYESDNLLSHFDLNEK